MDVITYSCWDWIQSILVEGATEANHKANKASKKNTSSTVTRQEILIELKQHKTQPNCVHIWQVIPHAPNSLTTVVRNSSLNFETENSSYVMLKYLQWPAPFFSAIYIP